MSLGLDVGPRPGSGRGLRLGLLTVTVLDFFGHGLSEEEAHAPLETLENKDVDEDDRVLA